MNARTKQRLAVAGACVVFATHFGGGCTSDDGDSSSPHREPEPMHERDRVGGETHAYEGVADVSTKLEIPRDATNVRDGEGQLTFVAPRSGTVWIVDVDDDDRMVYSGDVERKQQVDLDVQDRAVRVNGVRTASVDVNKRHGHRMYFYPPLSRQEERHDPLDLPRRAEKVAEGGGAELSYTAPDRGRVYVLALDDDRVVTSLRVKPGQRVTLLITQDWVAVDGKKSVKIDLRSKHTFRLYYDRE